MRKKKEKPSYEDIERSLEHQTKISKATMLTVVMMLDRVGNLQRDLNECISKIQDAAMERDQLGKHAPKKAKK